MMKAGQRIKLRVNSVSSEGAGVGRCDGQAVFVHGALPGELIEARLLTVKKSYATAELIKVQEASPQRVTPDCLLAAKCGGCAYRHADYSAEIEYKHDTVVQTLRRIGGISADVLPMLATPTHDYYRSRAVLHVDGAPPCFGFYPPRQHQLCAVDSCLLLRPELNDLLSLVSRETSALGETYGWRELALRCNANGSQLALTMIADVSLPFASELAARLIAAEPRLRGVWQCLGAPVYGVFGAEWRLLAGTGQLTDTLGELELELTPAAFTQVNSAQMCTLYNVVRDYASLSGCERVLDLYCGTGSIGLYLAREAAQVVGVESYAPAAAAAQRNATRNHADNCRFICGAAEDVLPELAVRDQFDAAILDPPRAGCDAAVLSSLAQLAPARIVYVSCDPATLARDLRLLTSKGYCVQKVQPVDMFSRTAHIETVVLMTKTQSGKDEVER